MKKFKIKYALSGGFGGTDFVDWEEIEADDLEQAEEYAYEYACDLYDSYNGMHGLRTVDDIMEEDEVDESEAINQFEEERESWLEYEAKESKGE